MRTRELSEASRRLHAFANRTVPAGHFAIAGSAILADNLKMWTTAVRHWWMSEVRSRHVAEQQGQLRRRIEESLILAKHGGGQVWLESVIAIHEGSITNQMYTLRSNVGFNLRAMYGLAKHGHTLDFLDQRRVFQSSPCLHGLIGRSAKQMLKVRSGQERLFACDALCHHRAYGTVTFCVNSRRRNRGELTLMYNRYMLLFNS
jgi:hypothetical protein